MRIAISGTHGVGKTTLARKLAHKLDLPMIEEVARSVAYKMGFNNTQEILDAHVLDKERFQNTVLSCQLNTEFRYCAEGFVSDRSVIDIAAYNTFYNLPRAEEARQNAITYAGNNYDLLLFIPLGKQPAGNDGFRLVDRYSQEAVNTFIANMVQHLTNCMYLKESDTQEQVVQVIEFLQTATRTRRYDKEALSASTKITPTRQGQNSPRSSM